MLVPDLGDEALRARLDRLCPDGLTIFTLEGDSIRGALVSTTRLVAEMRAAHGLGILETEVLGRAYTAAALLSATIKGDDRLAVKVEGNGPAGGFLVECTAGGDVRGRLFHNPIELDGQPETLDTAPLIGAGTISLTRYMAGRTEPVTGSAALKTGRVAEDLSAYFLISEQTRSSFTVGLRLDAEGRVAGAGGLFLQALPGASDEALDRVERLVYGMAPLGETFASGATRMDVCLRSFPFFDFNHLDDRPVRFYCPCSKERIGAYVGALPLDELSGLEAEGPFPLAVTCHNCGSAYEFSREEIAAMLAARR